VVGFTCDLLEIEMSEEGKSPMAPGGRAAPRLAWLPATVVATMGLALLAACGGGIDGEFGDGTPSIEQFSADREHYHVGERATLSLRWRGTQASLDPNLGPVTPVGTVSTPPLDMDSTVTLTVRGSNGSTVARSLTLPVSWRNRYQALPTPARLSGHAAVTAADGSVLLIGGSRGTSVLSAQIDRYDPGTGQLAPLGTMAEGRSQAQALLLPDGQVLIGGGVTSGMTGRQLERIDPRTGAIAPAGELSVPRIDAGAVVLADGRVLFCGGHTAGEGAELGLSRSCDLWEPATGSARRLTQSMTVPRAGHRLTRLRDGRVLVTGGYSTATPYRYAELFDPVTLSFAPVDAPVAEPLAQQVAVLHTDGSVLLIGGEQAPGLQAVPRAEVWRFDPQTLTFSARPPLALARTLAAAVALRNGQVLLFGGQTDSEHHAASAERYDPALGGSAIASLDQDRAYHSASRLPDGRVLIAGGETIDGAIAGALLVYE
jgi:hypothetical protein